MALCFFAAPPPQDDGNPFKEQEAWEAHQMGHAKAQFGSKEGRKDAPPEYDFVFEDSVDFIDRKSVV